jgi:hypothetical protein
MGLIVAAPLSGLPSADDLLLLGLKGARKCECVERFDFASQCEPVYRLSLLGPASTAGVHLAGGSGGRLFKLFGRGETACHGCGAFC